MSILLEFVRPNLRIHPKSALQTGGIKSATFGASCSPPCTCVKMEPFGILRVKIGHFPFETLQQRPFFGGSTRTNGEFAEMTTKQGKSNKITLGLVTSIGLKLAGRKKTPKGQMVPFSRGHLPPLRRSFQSPRKILREVLCEDLGSSWKLEFPRKGP